jgi:hypothetical protein
MSVYGPLLVCNAYRCSGREVRLLTYASDSRHREVYSIATFHRKLLDLIRPLWRKIEGSDVGLVVGRSRPDR